jgi:glycosyltransferase involved in cell wall biosynthesis
MKILIIGHKLPFDTISLRIANSIKYLSKKHKHSITLVSFKHLKKGQKKGSDQYNEEYCKEYCEEIETIEIPTLRFKRMVDYIIFYIVRIFSGDFRNILVFGLSREMQIKINELLKREEFDVIFVDIPSMLFYVSDVNLPKVLEIWTIPQVHYEAYKKLEKKMHKKLLRLYFYFVAKNHEKKYTKFNICITPTEQERDVLKSYLPTLNITVIPFGITTDLRSENFEQDFPSLIFIGNMGSLFNQRSILYFYKEIYPSIKETFPDVKLYIVGKDPSEEIIQMTRDTSVIVTGYVEDLRPYLARASVVTLPVHGYGIKTRILEAMAMGKPVVTSSEGIHGIDVTPGENIIIADDPEEFAQRVIELLNDKELRNRIGANARKLMEEEYSWEKMTDMLNEVFQRVVNKR